MYAAQLQMFADFICIFLQQLSQCAQCKEAKHPHKYTDVLTEKHPVLRGVWPAALLSGEAHVCRGCVSSRIAGSGTHTQAAAAAADWQTDRLADRPPRRVSALLKPRDRNPTAFCMWHGRLECVWVPCWHSSLSHCYNPGGAGSKHTS